MKVIKCILIIFCFAMVLSTATLMLRTAKDSIKYPSKDNEETSSFDTTVPEESVKPEPEDPHQYLISGQYSFAESCSCNLVDQELLFTYDGKTYTRILSSVNDDGDPITIFYEYGFGMMVVQAAGVWRIDITKTVDFGDTPQEVSEEFLIWFNESFDEYVELKPEPEPEPKPEPEPEPEPKPDPEPEEPHQYLISGEYTFASQCSCEEVDQEILFTYDGVTYSSIRSSVNDDGDPITIFFGYGSGMTIVQVGSAWCIDTTKTLDFGSTPQEVSEEFLTWFNDSFVSANSLISLIEETDSIVFEKTYIV